MLKTAQHAWTRMRTIIRPFFHYHARWRALVLFIVLITLVLSLNGLNVIISYVNRDFMTALQKSQMELFWWLGLLYAGMFGVITLAAVFKRYFEDAERRPGVTGENLLRLLETRLDNVVYRMGFAASRNQARQLVSHGHFTVNGRGTTVPSFHVNEGDKVEVREGSRNSAYFKNARDAIKGAQRPDWLTVDADKLTGSVTAAPRRDQMPAELNEQLVIEFYSR